MGYCMSFNSRTSTGPKILWNTPTAVWRSEETFLLIKSWVELDHIQDRKCLFKGEVQLMIANQYSQDECITQCRVIYIVRKCGCRPHSIERASKAAIPLEAVPECRFTQLPCLSGLNLVAVNCSHCLPLCNYNTYTVRVQPSVNIGHHESDHGAIVEISYDPFQNAVLYKQQSSFSGIDMMGKDLSTPRPQ
ncbi:hypothetical protein ONE63_006679 [Megalurothrips usitatus]|uniref:Uncharacterized protein n=1 Tax=Megalurothrips usitatus TaxID=439358 RepID=A0AAV7XZ24_9NEOP|nr:hypothetical protein ONE63_006679 [Megalurothrips usitatus]